MRIPLARAVARLLRERQRGGLPQEIERKVRIHIADAVGIATAAPGAGVLAEQVLEALAAGSGAGECGVIGKGRLAPALAAFGNSALMHILDFDDIHDAARLHPTSVTLPAALAAAQLVQAPASRVAQAVALGDELMCRLGVMVSPLGSGPGSDWFLTQLFGYFGAAVAGAVVMDLDEDQWVSALGLAYMQAAGGKQAGFGTGATARAVYPAFAAMGGMQACLMARAGVVGPEGSLDGAASLFRLYLGGPPSDSQTKLLLDPEAWQFRSTQLKPWPSCRLSHPYVAAALSLRAQSAGAAPLRVEAAVNASAAKLCRPLAQRRRPATLQDAKYSIPWMIAFTLVRGRVDLDTLNDAALEDAAVLDLAQRVEIVERLPDGAGHPPAEISLVAADGRSWEGKAGSDFDGMQEEAARDKFLACLKQGGSTPGDAKTLWSRLMAPEGEESAAFLFPAPDLTVSPPFCH